MGTLDPKDVPWIIGKDATFHQLTTQLMEQYTITAIPIKRPLGWLAGVFNEDTYANTDGRVEGKLYYANTVATLDAVVALVVAEIREGGG